MADRRPILLGMADPHSDDPRHALAPDPPGCSGWRLWKMLYEARGVEKDEYLVRFDRRNLCGGRSWDADAAVIRGRELAATLAGSGRTVVALGQRVWWALGFKRVPAPKPASSVHSNGCRWIYLPHPSGMNVWYNDALNRWTAGALLAELLINSGDETRAAS